MKDLKTKYDQQAEMLANRVKKRYNHLRKRFARQNIEVFRLYDWDIPEIRAVVDWYNGHLVVAEYHRRQSTPDWLPLMGKALGKAMALPDENVHLKTRHAGKKDGLRYERLATTNKTMVMSERELRFHINLFDYVDTGIFSDHRNTRQLVREMAQGNNFLNLYCYTGSFSCYAAKGGAKTTTSVDRSKSTLAWARQNMELNRVPEKENRLIQADTFDYLKRAKKREHRFDLAVVDPPSFSTTRNKNITFDILADHPRLLSGVIRIMNPGGTIFFSTNHQKFTLSIRELPVTSVKEITATTIPEDYKNSKQKTIHRCWKITV